MVLLTEPGRISDHIELLGDAATPCYLLRGEDKWALVDTAVAPIVPEVVKQLKCYPDAYTRVKYLLITHSHFDHVGGLSALRRIFPGSEVVASSGTREIFSRPGPMNYIRAMNDALVKLGGADPGGLDLSVEERIPVSRVVKEGDRIELGPGVNIEVYEVPGHSRCSLAYLLVPERALFSGEAMGYYNGSGKVLAEGLSDFGAYLDSLLKMKKLGARYLCLPHNGVLTGDEARDYFRIAYRSGIEFRDEVKEFFRQNRNDEEIIRYYIQRDYQGLIRLQPESVFRGNLSAMLRAIRKELGIGVSGGNADKE
jgi:glyoxylase-like metal-dependent hydrolase (beta-lactamase superfamily II)